MAIEWTASDVEVGEDITSAQYNALRADLASVYTASVPIGTVLMWAGTSVNLPDGFLVCDGTAVSRTTYADLYTIQGNTFGTGDGSTTFNLPDIRDRFTVGVGSAYSQNAKGGATTNNLTHTHTVNSHNHSIGQHYHTVDSHRHYTGSHNHNNGDLKAEIVRTSQYQMYLSQSGSYGWNSNILINLYNSSANATAMSSGVNVIGYTGSSDAGYSDYQAPNTNTAGVTSTGNSSLTTNNGGSAVQENRPLYIGIFYIIKVL
jgi:microcystin-dependent protein